MKGLPINIATHQSEVEGDLLQRYSQMEAAQSTVTPDPINPYQTVGQCPACKKVACMACKNPFSKEDPSASIFNHDCKEKLEALKKQHQDLLDGKDRGEHYQVCPHCRRYTKLDSACQHITCECGAEFCYDCGEATQGMNHWGVTARQCLLYPDKLSPAQIAYRRTQRYSHRSTRDQFFLGVRDALPRYLELQFEARRPMQQPGIGQPANARPRPRNPIGGEVAGQTQRLTLQPGGLEIDSAARMRPQAAFNPPRRPANQPDTGVTEKARDRPQGSGTQHRQEDPEGQEFRQALDQRLIGLGLGPMRQRGARGQGPQPFGRFFNRDTRNQNPPPPPERDLQRECEEAGERKGAQQLGARTFFSNLIFA